MRWCARCAGQVCFFAWAAAVPCAMLSSVSTTQEGDALAHEWCRFAGSAGKRVREGHLCVGKRLTGGGQREKGLGSAGFHANTDEHFLK